MARMSRVLLILVALSWLSAAQRSVPTPNLPRTRTLVYLQNDTDKVTYKSFFDWLEKLTTVTFTQADTKIVSYGEHLFDNIILFGTLKDMDANFPEFVDGGGNVMIVARPVDEEGDPESALPDRLREAAIECGVYFTDSNVIDSTRNVGGDKHTIKTNSVTNLAPVTGGKKFKELTYNGIAMQLENHNPLLIPFVTGESTASTATPEGEEEESAAQAQGTNTVLVAGLQTRLGARMAFAGSIDLFGEKLNKDNLEFAKQLALWTFQYRGVLRFSNVQHSKQVNDDRSVYRINDQLQYSVKIEEYVMDKWVGYKANDIQLEFTMIDPYIRQSMEYNTAKNDGTYDLKFQAPDVYGIFKFLVDYRRPGYTPLIFANQTTVRPLKLNEYERFIEAAFPYYAGVFSAMGGFFMFSLFYLYAKD